MFRKTLEKQVFAIWQQQMSQHRENRLAERMVCTSLFVWVLAGRIHLSTCPGLLFRKLHKLQPTLPGSCLVLLSLGLSGHSQTAWGSSSLLVTDSPLASDLLSSWTGLFPPILPQAILQADQQLLRRSWFMWHQRAAACHQERERQTMACAHHHSRLLRKAFCVWRESAQALRTE